MEKETESGLNFMADFLSRAWRQCARCSRALHSGDSAGMVPRSGDSAGGGAGSGLGKAEQRGLGVDGKVLGRGKKSLGTRGGWPWCHRVCCSEHAGLTGRVRSGPFLALQSRRSSVASLMDPLPLV